jgi:hypothetical protein
MSLLIQNYKKLVDNLIEINIVPLEYPNDDERHNYIEKYQNLMYSNVSLFKKGLLLKSRIYGEYINTTVAQLYHFTDGDFVDLPFYIVMHNYVGSCYGCISYEFTVEELVSKAYVTKDYNEAHLYYLKEYPTD